MEQAFHISESSVKLCYGVMVHLGRRHCYRVSIVTFNAVLVTEVTDWTRPIAAGFALPARLASMSSPFSLSGDSGLLARIG